MDRVFNSKIFQDTYPMASFLYELTKEEYAQQLLDARADFKARALNGAFTWTSTKEGWVYWCSIYYGHMPERLAEMGL